MTVSQLIKELKRIEKAGMGDARVLLPATDLEGHGIKREHITGIVPECVYDKTIGESGVELIPCGIKYKFMD